MAGELVGLRFHVLVADETGLILPELFLAVDRVAGGAVYVELLVRAQVLRRPEGAEAFAEVEEPLVILIEVGAARQGASSSGSNGLT